MDSDGEKESFEISDYDLDKALNSDYKRYRQSKESATYGIWAEDDDEDRGKNKFSSNHKQKSYYDQVSFVSSDKKEKKSANESQINRSNTRKVTNYDPFSQTSDFVISSGKSFGDWERHTSGFGLKMLKKMGYKPGEGLGKDGSGIVEPIVAKVRKGRAALGTLGPENSSQSVKKTDRIEEEISTIDENQSAISQGPSLGRWKKSSVKKSFGYVYRYEDDILRNSLQNAQEIDFSGTKILDMTGPQAKVLFGYHEISRNLLKNDQIDTIKNKNYENFNVFLLLRNIQFSIEECERNVINLDKKAKYSDNLHITLAQEKVRLEDEKQNNLQELCRIREIIGSISKIKREYENSHINCVEICSEIEEFFLQLKANQSDMFETFQVSKVAASMLGNVLKKILADWNPLLNPTMHSKRFKRLSEIFLNELSYNKTNGKGQKMNMFEQLIWTCWYPAVRKSLTTSWSPYNVDQALNLIDTWSEIVPSWMINNLLRQVVMPLLSNHLDGWDPLIDTVPVHSWIHPWIPLLGSNLHPLYLTIQIKFSNALKNWHPSDPSAKLILDPWKDVLPETQMNTLLNKSIAIKLTNLLKNEFSIKPHDQSLEPFYWVMRWKNFIPDDMMVSILSRGFFPEWISVLTLWLSHNPDYEQVSKWYIGWKSQFPASILANEQIKEFFNHALKLMHNAVNEIPATASTSQERISNSVASKYTQIPKNTIASSTHALPTSFKDAVAKMANEKNILFAMIPNRQKDGKPLYRFGENVIYFERGVIFRQVNATEWKPVSLNQLLP